MNRRRSHRMLLFLICGILSLQSPAMLDAAQSVKTVSATSAKCSDCGRVGQEITPLQKAIVERDEAAVKAATSGETEGHLDES